MKDLKEKQYLTEGLKRLRFVTLNAYYESSRWQNLRKESFRKNGNHCCLCKKCDTILHQHHKTYEELGTSKELYNLIPLCIPCHGLVHSLESSGLYSLPDCWYKLWDLSLTGSNILELRQFVRAEKRKGTKLNKSSSKEFNEIQRKMTKKWQSIPKSKKQLITKINKTERKLSKLKQQLSELEGTNSYVAY